MYSRRKSVALRHCFFTIADRLRDFALRPLERCICSQHYKPGKPFPVAHSTAPLQAVLCTVAKPRVKDRSFQENEVLKLRVATPSAQSQATLQVGGHISSNPTACEQRARSGARFRWESDAKSRKGTSCYLLHYKLFKLRLCADSTQTCRALLRELLNLRQWQPRIVRADSEFAPCVVVPK